MRTQLAITAALLLAIPAGAIAQAQAPSPPGGSTSPTTSTPTTSTPTTSTPAAPRLISVTPLVGQSRLTGAQIAAWFAKQGVTPTIVTPILDLANIFVDEGNAQNVRGDIAFAQSVLETGWFAYKGSMVKATDNNFSGLGACDTCTSGNQYPSPTAGVRAQIQHLWAYGDPAADPLRVARPLTDLRFSYVKPYGKSPTWEAMGGGNWATGTDYAVNVLKLYNTMLVFNGLPPINLTMGTSAPVVAAGPTGPLTVMVSRTGGVRLGDLRAKSGTLSAAGTAFGGNGLQRAAYGSCHVTWASLGAVMAFQGSSSGTCGSDAHVRAAVLSNPIWKTDKGLSPGDPVKRIKTLYRVKAGKGSGVRTLVKARNGARLAVRFGEGVVKALIVAVPAPRS